MKKYFTIIGILILLLVCFLIYRMMENRNYVYSMESLSINYSNEITSNDLLAQNIKVLDSKGVLVDTSVSLIQGNNKIAVIYPPKDGYITGENYSLYINCDIKFDIEGKFNNIKELDFTARKDEEIHFLDKNLETAVRRQINKKNGAILKSEIYKLYSLNCDNYGIMNLDGMENFTNLSVLSLSDNAIINIDKLGGLSNLEHLDLSNNKIKDISSLGYLIKLKTLWLKGNAINNYSPTKAYFNKLTAKDFKIN